MMNTEIVTSLEEIEGPHRLFYMGDDISDEDIELLIKKGLTEIHIYSKKGRELEIKVDHVVVSTNIEKNITLDITTISYDYENESAQDALFLFSLNHEDVKNNYIFLQLEY